MLLDFYRLRDHPFGVTPDPRYLYLSPTHREALASLFYGIETGRGFLALLAGPGMGKTTLLFQLLERLKNSARSAFLFQTQCDSRELLRYVLDAFGLDRREQDIVRMHGQLNEFLFREALAGRRVVLVIDEAQNLSDSVLETVRLLSDFEASDKKLLQIVIAGQPELGRRLLHSGMSQLRQRIAVRARLDPFPAAETVRYINHRLQVAGYSGPELFTPAAVALIAERSQGIPRNINNICFNSLSLGCATQCRKIGPEIVQEAVADLSFEDPVQQLGGTPAAPPVAPALPAAPQFSYSATGNDWWTGWRLRTAVLAAVIGSFAIYFGEHGKAGATRPSFAISRDTPATDGTARWSPSVRTGPSTFSPVLKDKPTPSGRLHSSISISYVVQPSDTLQKLCWASMGRYDDEALTEILKLNPKLTDPNHIEVGQQILLPRRPAN